MRQAALKFSTPERKHRAAEGAHAAALRQCMTDAITHAEQHATPIRKFGFHPSSINSFCALDGSSAPSDFDDRLQYFVEQAPRLTLAVARCTDVQLHRSSVD